MFNRYYVKYYREETIPIYHVDVVTVELTREEFKLLAKRFVYITDGWIFREHIFISVFHSAEAVVQYLDAYASDLMYTVTVVGPTGHYVKFFDEHSYRWLYKAIKGEAPMINKMTYFQEEDLEKYITQYNVIRRIDEQLEETP